MKKIILSLTLAAAILTSGFAYAAEGNPGTAVKDAFSREFAQIKDVKWDMVNKEGIYQATFIFNNESLQAFFTEEGDFLGTTRLITKSQLPILVTRELDKKYADAMIRTVFEHSMTDGLAYYITLVTKKGAIIVKATGNGELTVHQRSRQ
jgi:hypothetical protein